MKVLHLFYTSLPSATGGDIRSRDLIQSQRDAGIKVVAVTSPFQKRSEKVAGIEIINGISYYRTGNSSDGLRVNESDQGLWVKIRKLVKLLPFSRVVKAIAAENEVDVIHAHSIFFNGFSAKLASVWLGVPMVYEVRSLWEDRAYMAKPSLKNRMTRFFIRACETLSMKLADHVVTISDGLKEEIVSRGIKARKVSIIPNAVDVERLKPSGTNSLVRRGSEVFGYVGNISEIEGLELFLDTVKELRKEGWGNAVRIYGDGPFLPFLKSHYMHLEQVEFLGAFDPADVLEVYESLDVVVNPRLSSEITERVTPLKPLEAMALCKLVIVSSVGGMRELVEDGRTGLIFSAGSKDQLKRALLSVTENNCRNQSIVDNARKFVISERSWGANAVEYMRIYEELMSANVKKTP